MRLLLRIQMYSNCKLHSRCPTTLFESWGAVDPKVAQDHVVGVTTYENSTNPDGLGFYDTRTQARGIILTTSQLPGTVTACRAPCPVPKEAETGWGYPAEDDTELQICNTFLDELVPIHFWNDVAS